MESKKEKFKRLAEARTSKLLHDLKLLSNLANKRNYEYDSREISQIFNAIEKQLRMTKMSFNDIDNTKSFSLK